MIVVEPERRAAGEQLGGDRERADEDAAAAPAADVDDACAAEEVDRLADYRAARPRSARASSWSRGRRDPGGAAPARMPSMSARITASDARGRSTFGKADASTGTEGRAELIVMR